MNETERKELTSGFDVQTADLSGRWLVEASAGTGKTFALERIVLRLVIEEAVSIDRILVVTFTNAATAELRVRFSTKRPQCSKTAASNPNSKLFSSAPVCVSMIRQR